MRSHLRIALGAVALLISLLPLAVSDWVGAAIAGAIALALPIPNPEGSEQRSEADAHIGGGDGGAF